jgi:hypothetical protein
MAQANSQVLPENLPEAEIQEQAAEQPKLVQERMISEFEIEFLKSKLDACSTEFSDKVKNFLTEEGTINYSINEKIFSNIMKKIIKHLADHAVCEVEVKNEN